MEFKSVSTGVVDMNKRVVTVAISEVETKDLDNEIIASGAYTKTVSERGPGAANLIYHLADHRADLKNVIGKPMTIEMKGNKLLFRTDIPETTMGNDALKMYEGGLINQHSVGFATVKDEKPKKEGDPRVLTEVKLYEGSAVLWGANPNTPTVSVGKMELKDEAEFTFKEWQAIKKTLKLSPSDELAELLEIRLEMFETRLKYLISQISTKAVPKTLQPVNESKELADLLYLSSLKF